MRLKFDRAGVGEVAVVLEILNDSASWLRQQGIKQWPARFGVTDDWRTARIANYVEGGKTWLVRLAGEPVATFSLTDVADVDYADGWPNGPNDALYIFRMAVRRTQSGHNLGGQILDWATTRAAAEGKKWLRLDCHRHNHALQHYYEIQGFTRVGTLVRTITDNGQPYTRGSGALYQRSVDSIVETHRAGVSMAGDRYDPTGEAAVWQQASSLVDSLRIPGNDMDQWNAALEQAARLLENEARAIRQRDGMYFRVISGKSVTATD